MRRWHVPTLVVVACTEVEVLETGTGRCDGWLRVQADDVTSWVREAYVVDSGGSS